MQCSIPNPKSGGKNTKIPWISCSASIGGSPTGRHERWPASSSSLTLGSGLARYSSKISISLWPARGLGMSWVSFNPDITYQPNPSGYHGDIVGIACLFHGILDWIEINSAMPLLNGEVARLIYGSPGHSLHFLGGLQSLEK